MKVYLAMCYYYSFGSYGIYSDNWIINVCATEELAKEVIRGYKNKVWIFEEDVQNQIEQCKENIDLIKRCGCFEAFNGCRKVLEEFEHVVAVEEIEPTSEIWIRQVKSLDKENEKGWNFYIKEEEVVE